MERSYWEKIAPDYNEEIFDVLHHDKKSLIRKEIEELGSPRKKVMDAGCAIGKWLPVLSPAFGKVMAVDISSRNLRIAEKNHPQLKNVEYLRADMSRVRQKLPAVDVVVCINAILTPSMVKQDMFFQNIARVLRAKGSLVLVVPSLESYLLTRIVQQKWKIDDALFRESLTGDAGKKKFRNAMQGNLEIDNVPTKHYTREELILLLDRVKIQAQSFHKIEYDWTTEFMKPPRWLVEPRPWDWLCLASRR